MEWAPVVSAISSAVIAVFIVAVSIGLLRGLSEIKRLSRVIERVANLLDHDARPALISARTMVEDATKVIGAVRSEVEGVAETSRDVRRRVASLVGDAETRLRDLEALVDVVQYEVEETALDIAAALRTTRRGSSVVRAMKRAFLGGR